MPLRTDLTGTGIPDITSRVLGNNPRVAISAAGTTSADATAVLVSQDSIDLTATGSDGIRFHADTPLLRPYFVVNTSASTGKIYAATGGNWSGGSTDAGLSITTKKAAIVFRLTTTIWFCIFSAA